jgi:alpha,alpha-trehalose phosphorylase
MHIFGDAFSHDEKTRNFAYYEALTVRDSSLSAATQAVVAAEVGHLELAYDYFREAGLIDLDDLAQTSVDGLHIASLAGSLIAAVAGFGGLRDYGGNLSFAPRLPMRLERLAFRLLVRGRRLSVEATKTHATYTLLAGEPLSLIHHGETITISTDNPATGAIPPLVVDGPSPNQPMGRAPARRRDADG